MFSNSIVLDLIDYLDSNLYKKISIDELSKYFNYNKDYLMRLFKRELGLTIIEYLNRKRIYQCLLSMKDNNKSITYLSIEYGFYSLEYFSEIFKKYLGVSPSVYLNYLKRDARLSEKDIYTINDNLLKFQMIWKRIKSYQLNIKPTNKVKVLSIFK